jgi:hypothetical protein
LYRTAFSPTAQLTNVIIGDDDNSTVPGSFQDYQFTTTLATGTNYFLVSTGYNNGDSGAFTTTITGPGNVLTAVPEPFTIIGTLVGGTAALRMRKKLAAAK